MDILSLALPLLLHPLCDGHRLPVHLRHPRANTTFLANQFFHFGSSFLRLGKCNDKHITGHFYFHFFQTRFRCCGLYPPLFSFLFFIPFFVLLFLKISDLVALMGSLVAMVICIGIYAIGTNVPLGYFIWPQFALLRYELRSLPFTFFFPRFKSTSFEY
jgi:hypothetical protein